MLKKKAHGFTLLEMLIALVLLTMMTLTIASMVRPWMELRNRLETESRLAAMGKALEDMYELAAFTMDTPPSGGAGPDGWMALGGKSGNIVYGYAGTGGVAAFSFFAGGDLLGNVQPVCDTVRTRTFWAEHSAMLGMGIEKTLRDGSGATFCFLVGPERAADAGGLTLPYRQLYVIAAGKNGVWNPGSRIDPVTGGLDLRGDDMGTVVSGLSIHMKKLETTQDRVQRIARLYEKYFSMRYLSSNIRDVVKNYFTDPDGVVPEALIDGPLASGNYEELRTDVTLAPLGVVGTDALNAWEPYPAELNGGISNAIYMANESDGSGGTGSTEVRTPKTGAQPPYMAKVFTFIPGMQVYGVHAYGRY